MANPRRSNDFLTEPYSRSYAHAANANAGTVTVKIDKLSRQMKVTKVKYINPTGLAEDPANFALLSLKNGSVTIASWSTDSAAVPVVTIAADTFFDLTLSATDTDLVVAAGDTLTWVIAESGTTTVPAGIVIVEGVYI